MEKKADMDHIPGYKLIGKIGEGGMATVYKGLQVSLNRPVAIKILQKRLADHASVLERFERESFIIARLNNPHIIHVIDRGVTKEGMPYFVMEHVEGNDLESVIKMKDLDFNRKLDVVIQICKALSYAHKNGVIHRDIKPSNVLIDEDGNVQVLDFGIAQFYEDDDLDSRHTRFGTIMGTPDYMSPEQRLSADKVTALSDLYSLGVVMYEMFTKIRPMGRFRLPREIDPAIPDPLEKVIMACLESEPTNRPSSADEIKDRLLQMLRGAHLKTEQKYRAGQGISNIKEKFALLDVIKEEPYGSVYLYEDRVNQNLMVIKKRPHSSTGYMESKLLTSLRHPNLAKILGTSKNKSAFIIVMEYLNGGSLKDRLVQPYSVKTFLPPAVQICEGLSFAHRNRVVHGNLRPGNILFTNEEGAKITDFGLDEHYVPPHNNYNWYNPTGESKSVRGDILAAGVIFYQMLIGLLPEWEDDTLSLHSSFDSLPIELQAMLIRMLSIKKHERYAGIDDVIMELNSLPPVEDPAETSEASETVFEEKMIEEAPIQRAKPKILQLLQALLLLMVLIFVALAYLTYTGDIYPYIETVSNFWGNFLKF